MIPLSKSFQLCLPSNTSSKFRTTLSTISVSGLPPRSIGLPSASNRSGRTSTSGLGLLDAYRCLRRWADGKLGRSDEGSEFRRLRVRVRAEVGDSGAKVTDLLCECSSDRLLEDREE